MLVRVKLFVTLARFSPGGLPGTPFELETSSDIAIKDLLNQLQIPVEETKIAFVNGIIREMDYQLKPGDDVGIFPPIAGGEMTEIHLDVWLYGELARYAGDAGHGGYANLSICLPQDSTVSNLLEFLHLPTEKRGITFINGDLSAMPGLQPDLDHPLQDGDRIAFFHLLSMWPFQYRHGVAMIGEMTQAMNATHGQELHHSYSGEEGETGKND